MKNSTFSEIFQNAYPDHFFQGYIAEQNLVSVAVGLQARGKVPFADTFACFLSRAYDNVRMAAISRANINLCGSHCGVSIGEDGPSQMALEDIAMFRAINDSVVFYPGDAVSTERLVETMARRPGINYLRTSRPKFPILYQDRREISVSRVQSAGEERSGQSDGDRRGRDVARSAESGERVERGGDRRFA